MSLGKRSRRRGEEEAGDGTVDQNLWNKAFQALVLACTCSDERASNGLLVPGQSGTTFGCHA